MLTWLQGIYQDVAKRLDNRQLHHGLIFHGKDGIGKSQLCLALAKLLLCKSRTIDTPCNQCQSCKLFNADNHPDFLQIPVEKTIGVDAVREAIGRLLHTSQLGGSKVLFINDANLMTVAAANALLKTLEEPTQNTYILLSCPSLHDLLPTVLSRCEKHAVVVSDKSATASWLQSQGCTIDAELFDLYWQSPLFLYEQLDETTTDILDTLRQVAAGQSLQQLPLALFDKPDLVLSWIQQWVKQATRLASHKPRLLEQLMHFSQQLTQYKARCQQQGANKKLQLSLCMSDFSAIARLGLQEE